MARMKKFFIYFLLFVGLFIFVNIFTELQMKEKYENVSNHYTNVETPKITVLESKATYSYGYIIGNITNNTKEHLKDKYLQFDFYDKDGIYVGTQSKEIKYFNVDETIKYEINYQYTNVDTIKINFVDEVIKPEEKSVLNIENENFKIALPIASILGLFVLLP